MPANEAALVSQIWKAVRAKYPTAWIMKVHGGPYQMPGVPDLLMCVEGWFFGFEVKHQKPSQSEYAARMRATPQQQLQIKLINQAGGTARVILTPEEALAAIALVVEPN